VQTSAITVLHLVVMKAIVAMTTVMTTAMTIVIANPSTWDNISIFAFLLLTSCVLQSAWL